MDEMRREVLQRLGLFFAFIPTACAVEAATQGLLTETAAVPLAPPTTSGLTRSRTGPLPRIVKPGAQLIAEKLVLPFNRAFALRPNTYPTYTYKPFAWAEVGLARDMGSAGEREEIGIVTEAIASWLTGGSANNMLVQAEAHGTSPVHFRHKNGVPSKDGTGEMVNLLDDPRMKNASCYYSRSAVGADPWFDIGDLYAGTAKVRPDLAHYPNLCYVPYLATGDLYYLQEVQDAATYALIWANPSIRQYDKALIQDDQTRGYAWALNLLASSYLATTEAEKAGPLPAPLLPSSYWKRILDNNAAEFERRWVKNGDNNPLTGCHFAVDLTLDHVSPWQQDMLGAVMGWMIWTGRFAEWRGNYDWHMKQATDRASGKAGYPRSRACEYYYKTAGVFDMASLAKVNNLTETADGHYPKDADTSYASYLRANLKIAVMNGVAGAQEPFTYADAQARRRGYIPLKWAA